MTSLLHGITLCLGSEGAVLKLDIEEAFKIRSVILVEMVVNVKAISFLLRNSFFAATFTTILGLSC